jgi:hypothetical protein
VKRLLVAFVVAIAAACNDQTATQYVGTAKNDASPETGAKFTLTLYSRTDTSFGGVLDLGPPATGTGAAYAWYKGPELRIVSVAATGGDTIVWTSKLADQGLGGRFEVTGGERTGQTGTWRATLTKGLPATRETLRQPQTLALPPVSALWPVLLSIVVAGWLARWIRRTPQPVIGNATIAEPSTYADGMNAGVSGWLTLVVLGQVVGIINWFIRLGAMRTEYSDGMSVGAAVAGMQPLVALETSVQLAMPLLAVTGLVLIVRHHRYASRFWFAYFMFNAVYLATDLLSAMPLHAEMKRVLGAAYDASTTKSEAFSRASALQLVASLVWAQYWVRSRRVRLTFGSAALDRTARAAPGGSVAPIADSSLPASPSKRRRRTALRIAGSIVAIVVAIIVVGLSETAVRRYSVPEGADIRKTVAGRWTWTTDKQGCAGAHIIAFSNDGKVMTIVQTSSGIGAPDPSPTTYDITLVTRSSIRGAIRGEKRLTDDGTPVVWDLVLVSPDEYRWHRTDWFSAWGYTPSIVRCPPQKAAEGEGR